MQKQGLDALKRMALQAKKRLRNKVKQNEIKNQKNNKSYRVIFGDGVDIINKTISKEDTKFYEKLKTLLDNNIDVVNPISVLTDNKIFNKLDDLAKERYLFAMIEKYKTYKQKYEEEKLLEVM